MPGAAVWPRLSPYKVPTPHWGSLPKEVTTALCHSHSHCVSQGEAGVPHGSPPTPCQLGTLRQWGRSWLAQGTQCQGWGEQTGFLARAGSAALCLQVSVALCWVCSCAAALHPSSGSLGAVPVSPQVAPLTLALLNGAVVVPTQSPALCVAGLARRAAWPWLPARCRALFQRQLPVGMAWQLSLLRAGPGQDPVPWVTSVQPCNTRGHRCYEFAILSSPMALPPGFLCQLHP